MKTLLNFFLFLISISVHIISQVLSLCNEDQQLSLLHLKQTVVFDSSASSKLKSWNSSSDCCSWLGVTCSTNGRVIGLDLSTESISSGIDNSSSLFDLQDLQSLNLAYNYDFSGSQIPTAIGKLTNLRYLNLSHNSYFGQIPIEISYLTRLVIFDISGNFFSTDQLKLENPNLTKLVQNLTDLTELYLDDVNISAQGSDWSQAISLLPNMRVLSLYACDLSGPIHDSVAKLHSLSVIILDHNQISAPVPGFFANFSNLTYLSLVDCGLQGTFPKEIFQLSTLQSIDLTLNPQLQGSLPELPENGSLQSLVLSQTNFSGVLPNSIGNLNMLSRMDLSVCSFSGSIPKSVANLTQLVSLSMSSNRFGGSIASIQWKNLVSLNFFMLDSNLLSGTIPLSLFSIPLLSRLVLSDNQFSGQVPEFANISSYLLETLDLSGNNLVGSIPISIFNLRGLSQLYLSSNNLSGFPFSGIQQSRNLSFLDLSHNSLLFNDDSTNSSLSSLLQVQDLVLASNKLRAFPDFLRHQFRLASLDLSENQIQGQIPNWIWSLSSLKKLNLSSNSLVTLEAPLLNSTSTVTSLDLHSNQLQGQIPIFLPFANYLDYSKNNFTSSIPTDIGNYISSTAYLSLSSSNLHGIIPSSICNASGLVLDLSNNSLSGIIPECLTQLSVLDLGRNNLTGTIPDKFLEQCSLKTLDLSRNQIEGQFPRSLVNCTQLEVLSLGNNQITDTFPCLLKNISTLRVLVLRSNKFYGQIECPGTNGTWPMLQIIDLAHNNLSGEITGTSLTTWQAMMANGDDTPIDLGFSFQPGGGSGLDIYYGDSITTTSKGLEMDLVKILTVFTSIDFSSNKFSGSIPKEMGEFKALYVLNLSSNSFTGEIPSSFGNMRRLESLDLSQNRLNGQIPPEFAGLNFLSYLNLSDNELVGRIPTSTQFSTFPKAAFVGNEGLWGPPLTEDNITTLSPPALSESSPNPGHDIDWNIISVEIGYTFGFGIAIGSLMFCKRWREWYYRSMYKIVLKIFPQLEQRIGIQRRQVHMNQRWRR
ncbi:putative leucine-rich repeat-containing, plant-type, leucine-rich repeat domain, L [Rosa chinensis]|uniref:Putative leucine-rich repeat-containing, plant-type, leucine-rich repeat domain, L n=1 Tax=Rosa chinensis TaxID=74649 RepID=A0A2P6QCE1_ROSCH|nr:putative leucine-rich repeat-containing, plant-type, leucine-rich repeat domain, L [Rosa chinensis]